MATPSFIQAFYCYQVKARFQAQQSVQMQDRWYFLPRYALGNAMKKSVRYSHLYPALFRPDEESEVSLVPLVIRADKPTRRQFKAQETLDIYVTIITHDVHILHDFLSFLQEWDRYNFFYDHHFKYIGYQLFNTKANNFASDTTWDQAKIDYQYFLKHKVKWDESLSLRFTTPTTLKVQGVISSQIDYNDIVNRISLRCSQLVQQFLSPQDTTPLEIYKTHKESTILSNHISLPHNATIKANKDYNIAGFLGHLYIDVDYDEVDAILLTIARFIHIGNYSVLGNGQLIASPLPCKAFKQYIDALLHTPIEDATVADDYQKAIIDISHGKYLPQPYKQVFLEKPSGGYRELIISDPIDLHLQKVLASVLTDRIQSSIDEHSYAFRKGKSPKAAIHKIQQWIKHAQGDELIIRCDIDKFFDQIPLDKLQTLLYQHLGDPLLVSIIQLWLQNNLRTPDHQLQHNKIGIPQGSPISPILSNLYLTELDQFIVKNVSQQYIRYADDILICVPSDRIPIRILTQITDVLRIKFSLALNNDFTVTEIRDPFSFLGITFCQGKLQMDDAKKMHISSTIKKQISLDTKHYKKVREHIEGYKQYYGTLLADDELIEIDKIIYSAYDTEVAKRPAALDILMSIGGMRTPYSYTAPAAPVAAPTVDDSAKVDTTQPRAMSVAQILKRQERGHLKEYAISSELIIAQPGAFVGLTKNQIKVTYQGKVLDKRSINIVKQITIMSDGVGLSSNLISRAVKKNVQILYLNKIGQAYAVIQKPNTLQPAVIADQMHLDDARKTKWVVALVKNKINNQLKLLRYYEKYFKKLKATDSPLSDCITQMLSCKDECIALDTYAATTKALFLIEARAAIHYWAGFRYIVERKGYSFPQRLHQGAPDLINQMLNYGYAILQSKVMKHIYMHQLSPNISYLHSSKDTVPTLCFDLMEQYRAFVVDRSIISILTKGERVGQDKHRQLDIATRKKIIAKVNDRLQGLEDINDEHYSLSELMDRLMIQFLKYIQHQVHSPKFYNPKW